MLRSFTWTSSAIVGVESNHAKNNALLQQMRKAYLLLYEFRKHRREKDLSMADRMCNYTWGTPDGH